MYDVIIIGNGPAGISAGLYIKRANINVCIIGKDNGALKKTSKIENYYGFPGGIDGNKLIDLGIKQAKELGIPLYKEEVISITNNIENFMIVTNKNEYITKSIILATGKNRLNSNILGIKEFEGKGVSYCAVCDAFFFKNKDVAVLGNGNYAINEINELLPLVNKVTLLTNGKSDISLRNDKVEIVDKKVKKFEGNEKVENVVFEDNSKKTIAGVFIAEGEASSVDFARRIGANMQNNNIIVDENYMTNVEGVFAAGDAIGGIMQISKAVYDGTKVGLSVINYLRNKK